VELRGRAEALRESGLGLAAISYDSPQVLAEFSQRNQITYPLLSDAGSAVITRYGIRNFVADEALGPGAADPALLEDRRVYATVLEPSERLRGVPFPGTFIVDRDGRVSSRFFEDFYRERSTGSSIMLRLGLGAPPVQATTISTSQVEIRTYASNPSVAPGSRFSLAVDIAANQGADVYALRIDPQPHVRTSPPVRQGRLTLLVDVVLEATPEAQKALSERTEVVLTGTLEYQACDDTTCGNPVAVPLSWTVAVAPHVPGR
jgi:peroxiredoxin